ncbi:hypothetical protein KP79_PYT21337 [Mizuhopecten yessoensis]|uniref:Uncharacterized protein n=1 Tax=Mizuhopecten yessoensis TaxID=6573 RepID=A0A210PKY9_MIZYE|nr:hypothetical protein KP79_PYT21337 [Mizuhopecten yessoensis]
MSTAIHTEDGRGPFSHLHRKGLRDRTHFPSGNKDTVRNNKYSASSNNRNNRHLDRQGKGKPTSQVRRTLAFDTDDENDEDYDLYKGGLDFTDKIAAFRALIKPMKDPVSILKSKRDLDQLKDERMSKRNSNTFTVDIKKDTELRVSKNEDDTARAKRSLLGRKVDKELSRMSFINYQAHVHMMENGQGQPTKVGQHTPRHDTQNSVNKNASVSKILDEYLELHDQKKRCQNFSEGLESVVNGEDSRNTKPSSRKQDRHANNHNFDDVELKVKNKRRISQSNFDMDLIQSGSQVDHCDSKWKSSQIAQTNLSIGSDPLSDVGSLLNKDGGHKGLKTVQSNVPHYHPSWSSHDKESGQRSPGPASPHRKLSPRVPKTDSNAENFDYHYNVKNKFGSGPEEETKYQTNTYNFADPFKTGKSDRKWERTPRQKKSTEKDFTDLHERSKSGGRHTKSDGFKNKRYQQKSRSPGRNHKSDFWDNFMSDSSKENIPDSDVESDDMEDKLRKQKQKDRRHQNSDYITHGNIRNEKNRWKDKSELGNSRERNNRRKKDKHANDHDHGGLSDESLQIIPERDLPVGPKDLSTQVSKMVSKPTPKKYQDALESRVSDTSLSGSVWSSGSQSSVIQAAELIKRLYSADANTREELILKARFFRRWLKLVRRNHKGFRVNHTAEQEGSSVSNFPKSSSHKDSVYQTRSQKYVDSPVVENVKLHPTQKSAGLYTPVTHPTKHFHSTPRDGHLTGKGGCQVQNREDVAVDDNNDTKFKVIEDKVTCKADFDIDTDNHNLAHTRLLHIENFLEDALQEFKKNSADNRLLNGVVNGKSRQNIKESGSELEEKLHPSVAAQQNSDRDTVNIKIADPHRNNSVSSKEGKAKKKKRNNSLDRLLKSDDQSVKTGKDKQKDFRDQRQNNGVVDLHVNGSAPVNSGENGLSNSQPSSLIGQHLGGKFIKIQKKKRDSTTSLPVQVPTPIDSDQQLLDTANYGVCLQRAEIFLRDRLLKIYFKMWKNRAMAKLKESRAGALHRYHSLRKGMKAFSWAISRSRIQVDILQSRMTCIVLAARFTHWKNLAMKNRQERLEKSFIRWQCFTLESQKVRKLRWQGDQKILRGALTQWRSQFITRLKENKADLHFRTTLLAEQLKCWKLFTSDSKEKKCRVDTARLFFSHHLQNKMFVQMVMVFGKTCMAKSHHRKRTLHMVLVAWRQASHVCKVERQRDMSISREHWRMATTKQVFCHWHDQLLVQRTRGNKNKQLIRNAFHIWRVEWTRLLAARLANEARLRREILTTALQLWRANVELLQRRRQAGIIHLQRALVRHALLEWQAYTQHRKELRKIMTVYKRTKDLQKQRRCLSVWRHKFEDRLDIQKAKQFWSNICVRKALDQWKKLCHRHMLYKLLEATKPNRNLALKRVMFQRWLEARSKINCEKKEADQMRTILEHSQLQRSFQTWWIATQQRLTIKPMLLRQQRAMVTEVFDNWRWLVKHKATCKRSSNLFQTCQLQAKFSIWRRQYLIHQLEKDVRNTNNMNRLRRCVQGWRLIISRKHTAHCFHQRVLVRQTFLYWREKALGQLERRVEANEIEAYHMSILRSHFDLWLANVREKVVEEAAIVVRMDQERTDCSLRTSFLFWRRHFRAIVIARENQALLCRKLQLQAIQAWHHLTQARLHDAVHNFAVRLGLELPNRDNMSISSGVYEYGQSPLSDICPSPRTDFNERTEPYLSPGSGTPRRIEAFYSSGGAGTPNRRLFSPSFSLWSLDQDNATADFTLQPTLADKSFLDTRFAMEQAVKTEKLRTLVFHAVKRLRFWPISVAFDQWKEFTNRQRELKALSNQLQAYIKEAEMRRVLRIWRTAQANNNKAKTFMESSLKTWVFTTLYENKCVCKQKKQLSALAHHHLSLKVFRKVFPVWFEKAKEKRHQEHVCHLWTNLTPEEHTLLPLETTVKGRIEKKTLQKCFAVWNLKFQQIYRLKKAFDNVLLQRYLEEWQVWSHQRRQRREQSVTFCTHRLNKQVFYLWRLRYQQQSQVEIQFKNVWQNHLMGVVREWHRWTLAAKQHRHISKLIEKKQHHHLVVNTFMKWRLETRKHQQITVWYQSRLALKVFYSWHQVTAQQKTRKRQILEFRVRSYTKLVGKLFRTWHNYYISRLQQHQEHEKVVRMRALQLCRRWHRKAQTTRGCRLQQHFKHRQLQSYFRRWRTCYDRHLEREDTLACYVARKDEQLVGRYLTRWRTSVMCCQAGRMFDTKLTSTVFTEWRVFTAEAKKRRAACAVFQRARQQRSVVVQFLYWVHITRVRRSIHHHFNLKLQIRVLRGWAVVARRRRKLKSLSDVMTARVNRRVMISTWYTMREDFDYYQSLTDMCSKVAQDKDRSCLRQALVKWRERLNRVIAGHCYHHMLARRGVRVWRRFVSNRKQERQHQQDQEEKAVRHHNRHISRMVLYALHSEILVVHQVQRHSNRLSQKYGRLWKLRVDMMYTAKILEKENLYKTCWRQWRIQFAQQLAVKRMYNYNEKHLLAQVFVTWKNVSLKRKPLKYLTSSPIPSCIPVLRLPNTGLSSGESTPSPSPRPTQIPGPLSARGSSVTGVTGSRLKQRRSSVPGIIPIKKN